VCLVAFVVVYFVLDTPAPSDGKWITKIRKVDFLGAFCLILAIVALLVGLDSGSNLGWSHRITIVSLSVTPVLFALFIYVEVKIATFPFAPGHIILHQGLFACYLSNFCSMGAYTAILFTAPLFFQAIQGASAMATGVYLVPAMLAIVVASLGGGWIVKRTGRYYWISVLSLGLALASALPLIISVRFKSTVGEIAGLIMVTLGGGSAVTTTLVGLIANAESSDMAIAVACSYLFRSLGGSMAVSLSSAALQQVLRTQLASRFPNGEEAREIEEKVRQSLDYIKQLSPEQAKQVVASYQIALLSGYGPTTVLLGAGLLVSFWIKEKPLK
jgi:hypothetical protein